MYGNFNGFTGNSKSNLIRIGVFYDGSYFYKVSTFYKRYHRRRSRISVRGLQELIRHEVAHVTQNDLKNCRIVDTHYFGGRHFADKITTEKLQGERRFNDVLMAANVTSHFVPFQYDEKTGRVSEKRVDVWLALEAYEMAIYKRYDMLVLVAGDSDFIPLVQKLNSLGTSVMLVGWNVSYSDEYGRDYCSRMSVKLLQEVNYPVPVHEWINAGITTTESNFRLDDLFVPMENGYYSRSRKTPGIAAGSFGISGIAAQNTPEYPPEFESEEFDNPEFENLPEGEEYDDEYEEEYEDDAYAADYDDYDDDYDDDDNIDAYAPEDIKVSTIVSFNFGETQHLYGFIKGEPGSPNIYFGQEALANINVAKLRPGMEVNYVAGTGYKGTPVASKVWGRAEPNAFAKLFELRPTDL